MQQLCSTRRSQQDTVAQKKRQQKRPISDTSDGYGTVSLKKRCRAILPPLASKPLLLREIAQQPSPPREQPGSPPPSKLPPARFVEKVLPAEEPKVLTQTATFLESLKTVVISLDRRPDRMDDCTERLHTHCPGLKFSRFRASDGRADVIRSEDVVHTWDNTKNLVYCKQRSIRKGWDDLHTYHERKGLTLSPGERGCAMSHIRAWQLCLDDAVADSNAEVGGLSVSVAGDNVAMAAAAIGNKPLLVLEDDAAPTPEFVEGLTKAMSALPADAHLLYLGYSQAAHWRRDIAPHLVESEYVWTTVGYIIWPAGARLLMSQLPVDGPVDNFMAQMCADGDLKAYCVRPKIIRQCEEWNVNSDVGHSDEAPSEVAVVASIPRAVSEGPAFMQNLNALVINLDRRPDRMNGCTERLENHCPGLKFSRFRASDGKLDVIRSEDVVHTWDTTKNVIYQKKRSIRKGWDDLHTYHDRHGLALSAGERGCAMSHVRAWQACLDASTASSSSSLGLSVAVAGDNAGIAAAAEGNRPLLVLEDDAAPTPDFVQVLEKAMSALPTDAHVLYLGYSQAAEWKSEISAELVESEYVWTTVGYIVWPAGAKLLMSQLPVSGPVDNWMAQLCADGELKAYCVRPKIIRQSDAWNVSSDVGHSDEQYWGPCSDILHSDDVFFGSDVPHSDASYWGPDSDIRHSDEFFWGPANLGA